MRWTQACPRTRLPLNTLGQIAGDAYHVRQPDAYQKQAGIRSWRRIQVGPRTLLAHDLGPIFRRRREMYWAVDTGLSPHTLTLNTSGHIAGDAYHVRQPDAY